MLAPRSIMLFLRLVKQPEIVASARALLIFVGGALACAQDDSTPASLDGTQTESQTSSDVQPAAQEWTRQWGGRGDAIATLATDRMANIFAGGLTQASLQGQNLGSADAFVTKLNRDGIVIWTRQFGSAEFESVAGMAADEAGNVFAAGTTGAALPGQASAGLSDAFLVKIDGLGNVVWTRQWGSAAREEVAGVGVDATGMIFVAGHTSGAMQPGVERVEDSLDGFVSKFDGNGSLLWSRQWGTVRDDEVRGLASDSNGDVVVVGATGGSLVEGAAAGLEDAYAIRLDSQGTIMWTRQWGSAAWEGVGGVAVDAQGEAFVAGYTSGHLARPVAGLGDAFLTKFERGGALRWTSQWGGDGNEWLRAIALDSTGRIYVSGGIVAQNEVDPQNSDAWINMLNADGSLAWTRTFGSKSADLAQAVAAIGNQQVVVGGTTSGMLSDAIAGRSDAFVARLHALAAQ
jgi:hypothetical protein